MIPDMINLLNTIYLYFLWKGPVNIIGGYQYMSLFSILVYNDHTNVRTYDFIHNIQTLTIKLTSQH